MWMQSSPLSLMLWSIRNRGRRLLVSSVTKSFTVKADGHAEKIIPKSEISNWKQVHTTEDFRDE